MDAQWRLTCAVDKDMRCTPKSCSLQAWMLKPFREGFLTARATVALARDDTLTLTLVVCNFDFV